MPYDTQDIYLREQWEDRGPTCTISLSITNCCNAVGSYRIWGPMEMPTKANRMREYMHSLDQIMPRSKVDQTFIIWLRPRVIRTPLALRTDRQSKVVHQRQQARRKHRRESPRPRTKLRR